MTKQEAHRWLTQPGLKATLYHYDDQTNEALRTAVKALAKPQERRGKWIYSDGKPATIGRSFGVICTACNEKSEYCTPYCPMCGARMEADND